MIRRLGIALALCCAAPAGWACGIEAGAADAPAPPGTCAATRTIAPDGVERLGVDEDIWPGYVVHVFHVSVGCTSGEAHVVVDCADGTAYSFAPAGAALMTGDALEAAKAGAYAQLVRYVREKPRGYDAVAGWHRADELTLVDLGPVYEGPVVLGENGQAYDLTCGCKRHYPGSEGGW